MFFWGGVLGGGGDKTVCAAVYVRKKTVDSTGQHEPQVPPLRCFYQRHTSWAKLLRSGRLFTHCVSVPSSQEAIMGESIAASQQFFFSLNIFSSQWFLDWVVALILRTHCLFVLAYTRVCVSYILTELINLKYTLYTHSFQWCHCEFLIESFVKNSSWICLNFFFQDSFLLLTSNKMYISLGLMKVVKSSESRWSSVWHKNCETNVQHFRGLKGAN